jgi:integrase
MPAGLFVSGSGSFRVPSGSGSFRSGATAGKWLAREHRLKRAAGNRSICSDPAPVAGIYLWNDRTLLISNINLARFFVGRIRNSTGRIYLLAEYLCSGLLRSVAAPGTSVYRRPDSPYWCISYSSPTKLRRVHERTRFRLDDLANGKRNALRYAAEKSAEAEILRTGRKGEAWEAWAPDYLKVRYGGSAVPPPLTYVRYRTAWERLSEYLAEVGCRTPADLTYSIAAGFIEWACARRRRSGRRLSRNTAISEFVVLGIIQREAVRRGFAQGNPCHRAELRRVPRKEKPEITDAQFELIERRLAEKEGHLPLVDRWMTISFAIAKCHGTRSSATQIPMSSIDFAAGTIRFSEKGSGQGKKVYTVAIHPALLPLLTNLRDAGATQTCSLPAGKSQEWTRFFHAPDAPELHNLCFHCCRVTVITRLARAGVPIQQSMAYVGHASATVHRIYQRLQAQDLSRCTAALAF